MKRIFLKCSLTLFATSIAVLFLMPLVLTIADSFMTSSEITANYGMILSSGGKGFISETVNVKLIPDMVSFKQYFTILLQSPDYLIKLWNSFFLVIPIVVFQLLIACLASYGFMLAKGKVAAIVFFIYIILMLLPYQVTLVPNFIVAKWLHLLDTNWSIWFPGIFAPFSVYLLTKYMKRIPTTLLDAAQIDGAGPWKIFVAILLPLCRSAIFSCSILIFIDYWNMVEQPLIMFSDAFKYPLSVFLSKVQVEDAGIAFAAATVYMIPVLLLFLYGEEYLIDGIMYQEGIKG